MGRVWVAEHLTLHTNVVVKLMAKEIAESADGVARFSREASAAAAVKSPHVAQVFDHGVTADGQAYIVMELLEGRDLAAHLAATGPMSPRDVAALVAQVAKALGKAHQVGVVHRDIKPENIFLCEAEAGEVFVKVLDFGIAKNQHRVEGSATTTGMVVGTPYYMSPEQIVGEKDIDARSDIWSLGVVAFEAMTGQRPFLGSTVGAITLAIHTASPRITTVAPGLPAALDAWFAKACAREPSARFPTAREASQALLQAVGDVPSSVPLLRAPMPSLVGGAGDSDPALVETVADPSSDGRAATNLSSVFPVPHPKRGRSVLVIGSVVAVLALVSVIGIVAFARSKPPEPNLVMSEPSHTAPPSATLGEAPPVVTAPVLSTPASTTEPPIATASASASASTQPAVVVTPKATAFVPGTRSSARPATSTKPVRPSRRDDDDIK